MAYLSDESFGTSCSEHVDFDETFKTFRITCGKSLYAFAISSDLSLEHLYWGRALQPGYDLRYLSRSGRTMHFNTTGATLRLPPTHSHSRMLSRGAHRQTHGGGQPVLAAAGGEPRGAERGVATQQGGGQETKHLGPRLSAESAPQQPRRAHHEQARRPATAPHDHVSLGLHRAVGLRLERVLRGSGHSAGVHIRVSAPSVPSAAALALLQTDQRGIQQRSSCRPGGSTGGSVQKHVSPVESA